MSGSAWIYHERQDALLCGQHALNNLVQECVFSADALAEIAHQLDEMELTYMAQNNEGGIRSKEYLERVAEGSGNVDETGNFSIEVLRAALQNRYDMSLPNIAQQGVLDGKDVTGIEGFICNRDSHWFAIRKINGRYWNLNSTKERPEFISQFRLAAEIQGFQEAGYSVFCVVDKKLPPPCITSQGRERGLPQYWWKEEDLVKGKADAITGANDPWRNVGGGMRLDGKSSTSHQGLTEDEMLHKAVEASLETEGNRMASETRKVVKISPEPAATQPGTVRIQFRLPDGGRVIRRFLGSDPVSVIYMFVEEKCPGQGRKLELRAGFPPADLASKEGETIENAKISGENIQCRYL